MDPTRAIEPGPDVSRLDGGWGASPNWVPRAVWCFVALGLILRVVRYLQNFPMWCDESLLAANLLDRGYADLARPLDYTQVAPLLFLWIERAAVDLFGFSEWSLRLFPFLCGLTSVLVFRVVAGRVLQGVPLLGAVALLAVSGWPLRFNAEVKPYASDFLLAASLTGLAIESLRRPNQARWFWGLAALAPCAVALSFPSVFVLGAVLVALAPGVRRERRFDVLAPYGLLVLGTFGTFLVLQAHYRSAAEHAAYFQWFWREGFPPLDGPLTFLRWFVLANTGRTFSYPEGEEHGGSTVQALLFLVGAAALWGARRHRLLLLFLTPFVLGILAAAMHRYPYGMVPRTMQYVGPQICLLIGLGAAAAAARIASIQKRERLLVGALATLAALGAGRAAIDLAHPYKFASDAGARNFAKWFWTESSRDGELVCARADLKLEFRPEHAQSEATEQYRCLQRIYSPRHAQHQAPRWERVSEKHPLRCVFFNTFPLESPECRPWLERMLGVYQLRDARSYSVDRRMAANGPAVTSSYVVLEFIPKPESSPSAIAAAPVSTARR